MCKIFEFEDIGYCYSGDLDQLPTPHLIEKLCYSNTTPLSSKAVECGYRACPVLMTYMVVYFFRATEIVKIFEWDSCGVICKYIRLRTWVVGYGFCGVVIVS